PCHRGAEHARRRHAVRVARVRRGHRGAGRDATRHRRRRAAAAARVGSTSAPDDLARGRDREGRRRSSGSIRGLLQSGAGRPDRRLHHPRPRRDRPPRRPLGARSDDPPGHRRDAAAAGVTLFDPDRGRPVVAPPCAGPGCWAGAPGAFRDGSDLYVVYRMRRPHPGRGYELRIGAVLDSPAPELHATGDALSTGRTLSATGVAASTDGKRWTWEGSVLAPSASGWDSFTTRLGTVVRDGAGWLGLYDGGASIADNYEERCGLARSSDLRHWERVSVDGPAIGTARGPGGVRYVDITDAGDVFYEYTRPDGAHELRLTHTG